MPQIRDAVIVACYRSPVGKAPKGSLAHTRPDQLGVQVVQGMLERLPNLPPEDIEDVAIGCAMPEAEQGLNVSRIIACASGIPNSSAALTINRFCASGLQTISMIAERVMLGAIDCGIAGGIESMSLIPMAGHNWLPDPEIAGTRPELYMPMGLTAENVAKQFEVSRADQDAFAFQSHQRALTAQQDGRFSDEIIPIQTSEGKLFSIDEGPRADTSLEALSQLKPVFHTQGSVTAGNSSQTSDGAAAAVIMSADKAKALGLHPLARYAGFAVAGVAPEIMGIGPIEAIPKVLKQVGLSTSDIDLIELNEAFASQSLAVIRKLKLDQDKINVYGGAIALGHPLGCTGTKLSATLIHEMQRRQSRYGMVTMCIGGGMGAAGIFERMS